MVKMDKSPEINELKIVFIYDRLSCRHEEDDPKDAILYFHPNSVSVEKRVAICGQLMGVSHFFTDTFSSPKILTLANGKFALRNFGKQYVLALGCSSITSDWLLDKEADILESLIKFFHCDIQTILEKASYDRGLIANKLTSMMDHYIPISQHHGDLFSLTFGILPILHLPKSASNISLQASVVLQTCMLKAGVLGGIVMYQNKVVGVELGQNLAQKLAFIQPYRMPPADLVTLNFKLPLGVQIFRVYISKTELRELFEDSSKFQNPAQEPYSRKKKVQNGGMRNPIEEEVSDVRPNDSIDISSGIHSDENGLDFSDSNLVLHNGKSKKGLSSSVLSRASEDCNGFLKLEPRRCQSVVELHHDLGLNTEIQMNLDKKLGASLGDPTFPYMTPDGRHSVSSSFNNNCSRESSEDEVDHQMKNGETHPSPPVTSSPIPKPEPLRRPKDLPLLQSSKLRRPQGIKKKLWDTFNESLSPIEAPETLFENVINDQLNLEIIKKITDASELKSLQVESKEQKRNIPESIHLRLLNSFRRVSSHEDEVLEEEDGNESSGSYSSSVEQLRNSRSSTASIPSKLFPPRAGFGNAMSLKRVEKQESVSEEKREEVGLYIYYDGSMRLLLLLDPKFQSSQDLIESLWEYVSTSVISLKTSVMAVEEQSSLSSQSDPYCFLRYESVWRSLAHGGRNESMDFNTVQVMHRDFTENPKINELIIRGDDHVVYGYQCVGSEVYYQQRAGLQPGLPMPSDLMGKVPLKAKRRLERDHSIVLL